MPRTLSNLLDQLPRTRRRRIEAEAAKMIAEEYTLRNLRKAMRKTQSDVARRLAIGQDTVSRLETRADVLLSTLRKYVRSLGGELDLIARFPDRDPVRILSFAEVRPGASPDRRTDAKRSRKVAATTPRARKARGH